MVGYEFFFCVWWFSPITHKISVGVVWAITVSWEQEVISLGSGRQGFFLARARKSSNRILTAQSILGCSGSICCSCWRNRRDGGRREGIFIMCVLLERMIVNDNPLMNWTVWFLPTAVTACFRDCSQSRSLPAYWKFWIDRCFWLGLSTLGGRSYIHPLGVRDFGLSCTYLVRDIVSVCVSVTWETNQPPLLPTPHQIWFSQIPPPAMLHTMQ